MKNKINKNILIPSLVAAFMLASNTSVMAQYGGGGGNETEYKSLQVTKQVKLDGDVNFRDKIYIDLTNQDEKGKEIIFKVTVKNRGDKIDNLKYEDFLPSALNKKSGNLTQDVGSLNTDETKTYEIKTSLKDDEVNRDTEFEKCVVNKVDLTQDGDFEDSDVATVCYGNVDEPTQLPETGFVPLMGMVGLGLITAGRYIKKRVNK